MVSKKYMKRVKFLITTGCIFFGFVLLYGFVIGDFSGEGSLLLSMPWGVVSLIDVYLMFFLFSGWIYFREQNKKKAVLWIIAVMILGSFTAYLYTLLSLINARGNWKAFWLGEND